MPLHGAVGERPARSGLTAVLVFGLGGRLCRSAALAARFRVIVSLPGDTIYAATLDAFLRPGLALSAFIMARRNGRRDSLLQFVAGIREATSPSERAGSGMLGVHASRRARQPGRPATSSAVRAPTSLPSARR